MASLATPAAASTALVTEMMAQGRKSAAALEALLPLQDHAGIRELTAEILLCCDRALAALHDTGRKKRKSSPDGSAATQTTRPKRRTRASRGETAAATTRVARKRNWDDGFLWTKYGQKDIRGSGHPRHYFRCAYKLDAGGCPARRQVQRSEEEEEDPFLYVITYFGDHTCCHRGAEANATLDHVKTHYQSLVLGFGSAGGRSPRPDGDAWSAKTSRSAELATEVAKVESTPSADLWPLGPTEGLRSSANDVRCSSSPTSAAWDPSATADWDYFGNCSFDYLSEFFEL
ncbi:hypothetical protein ZWY2020_045926 [Hordeum vulgare]|nr:hypothetical protein ZWY2020_045926 [Hordeum vulgare]